MTRQRSKKAKTLLYRIGVICILLGAGIATFATFYLYFYLIPLWFFLFGVILVWISGKSIRVKLTWTIAPILIFISYQLLWRQLHTVPPETFLIPADYRGKIHIHFNKPCGAKPEKQNSRRIYRIKPNGILLSQFPDKQGFINQQFYLVDPSGKQTRLPQLDVRDYNEPWTTEKNPKEPSRNLLGVFFAGRVYNDGTYEFYVCTYNQLQKRFDFQYDQKFDRLEKQLLDACKTPGK